MVKSARYIPERGDIVWLNFTPHAGHEQGGRRPALILSPATYNRILGLALVCPITNQIKGYPWEVRFPEGLKAVSGVVLADQVRSQDWRARQAERIGAAPAEVVAEVLGKALPLLNPQEEA